ncbi:Sec-independent protein translocase protein TatB [Serratia microhaemolytica]|uniref:Sec-independent protein translocase protein TatB n=1 Tax=Serratia microhaemolytica TaxID=2675110 RepID=UPI000FDE31F6|nr:Sec-independent protein translocase protein TatB [Serratia microhaemolytica]
MFDIGFSELMLVMVIGLVVLGPERLPVAIKTIAGWIRSLRSLAASVQNELTQELKLQELQQSLKKAEEAGLQNLTPELKASMEELKGVAESLKRSYQLDANPPTEDPQGIDPEAVHDGMPLPDNKPEPSSTAVVKNPSVQQPPTTAVVAEKTAAQQTHDER